MRGWRYTLINRTKTLILLATLTALLLGAGQALAGNAGLAIAVIVALVLNFGSYWFSDKVVLRMYGAREVEENDAARLYAIVRDLAARAKLPMPKVYLIPEAAPNAFATGRNPQHAAVAVTEGLLRKLDRNELAAVIAHELAHIKNRDTLIMTVAATIAGALSMLANTAMWGMMLGSGRSSEDRDSSPMGGLLAVIVAPFLALLIQMAISRSREFLADESGARIAGDPLALASALGEMEALSRDAPIYAGSPATAHLFIVNPVSGGVLVNLFSTHPRTEIRIQRLQSMMALAPTSEAPPRPTAARRTAK
jgi:heat shock protein HtpX